MSGYIQRPAVDFVEDSLNQPNRLQFQYQDFVTSTDGVELLDGTAYEQIKQTDLSGDKVLNRPNFLVLMQTFVDVGEVPKLRSLFHLKTP